MPWLVSPPPPPTTICPCAPRLNGTLASAITLLTYLSQLNLSRNRLQGSLPLDLWYLPQLARVDLSANNFTGGLSSAVQ